MQWCLVEEFRLVQIVGQEPVAESLVCVCVCVCVWLKRKVIPLSSSALTSVKTKSLSSAPTQNFPTPTEAKCSSGYLPEVFSETFVKLLDENKALLNLFVKNVPKKID